MAILDMLLQALTGGHQPQGPAMFSGPGVMGQPPTSGALASPDDLIVQGRLPPRPMQAQLHPLATPDVNASVPVASPPNLGKAQMPVPPRLNYDNSGDAAAINQAASVSHPQGGSPNPGIYGLLPASMQHGTLRNVIGAISDAFLARDGQKPEYANSMARQQIGQAQAGMDINDPDSVAAASQRIANTGAPGSLEIAHQNTELAEQAAIRKQTLEYNNDYRQSMLGIRQNAQQAQASAIADRYLPQIGPPLTKATTPEAYTSAYQRLIPLAKRLGGAPEDVFPGVVRPEEWQPGIMQNFGMTANNQQVSSDKREQRYQSQVNAGINAGGRSAAAAISANRPSPTTEIQQLTARIHNGTATAEDQQRWAKINAMPRGTRGLPPGLNGGGNTGGGLPPPAAISELQKAGGRPVTFSNNQVWRLVNGHPQRVK